MLFEILEEAIKGSFLGVSSILSFFFSRNQKTILVFQVLRKLIDVFWVFEENISIPCISIFPIAFEQKEEVGSRGLAAAMLWLPVFR